MDKFTDLRRVARALLDRVEVSVFAPTAQLAPFVRSFTIVETSTAAEERVLLPEPGLVLGLRFRGHANLIDEARTRRLADHAITGFHAAARRIQTEAGSAIVLCTFHPTGAACLFRAPLDELFGTTSDAEQVIPRAELARIAARMASAADHAGRISLVEQFLAPRFTAAPDLLVTESVRAIRAVHGNVRIAALARRLAISIDPLEKRFRRVVGASPKQFARLVRLRHVIAEGRAPQRTWSRAAVDAGYFDQAHFNREFRALTGAAPTSFFRDTAWC